MSGFSRDSFKETQNILNDVRGVTTVPQDEPRHYVSLRLQQGVPLLDADWNEVDDIRRLELEALLVKAIGNGVPAGSGGFAITAVNQPNDLQIEAGILFLDGWLVVNRQSVSYAAQPHRVAPGVAPALPVDVPTAPVARTDLVFLDGWEHQVGAAQDARIVDPRIGMETSARLERVWVVRVEPIEADADPRDPETIPHRQAGHRYYPLATLARQPGSLVTAGMITDLRRTHLTLEAVTHAPLFLFDPVRDQTLDAQRLADAFDANLAALDDVFRETPEAFVFPSEVVATWGVMSIYNDLRALAVTARAQATMDLLPPGPALQVMSQFFTLESAFSTKLGTLLLPPPDGISAGESTEDFLELYNAYLLTVPESLEVAIQQGDLLGAVLAQERINHEISQIGGSRLDGTVALSLISVDPNEPVVAGVTYQVTVHITSLLISANGEEDVRVVASAGAGWNLAFPASEEDDARVIVLTIPNQSTRDVVLTVRADLAAAATDLELKAFPERRKLRVFRLPDLPLAIGSNILPGGGVIASLTYQGPPLAPDGSASVPRAMAFNPGVPLPFRVENLSGEAQTFALTIEPEGSATGWDDTPSGLPMAPLASEAIANVNVTFKTSNQAGAVSPQLFTVQLKQVVEGGEDVPLPYTAFPITFVLTP